MSKARLLSLALFGTIGFPFLDELIWRVVCTSTPQPSDHYGQTGLKLCGLLSLTTLGTELSALLRETRGQEGVFVWNPLMCQFLHWVWRILCVILCIHSICKDTTNRAANTRGEGKHTSLQIEEKHVYTTYSYHSLAALKEVVSLGPIFNAFIRFFLVCKYPLTYKFHGWMISALHLFLEHMPSGQNSQKGSLYSS